MEMVKKKILIISGEAWRDESNGGNVLSNLFEPLKDEFEFAQIYTNSSLPNNKLCTKYFHISESKMLKSVFNRKPFGRILKEEEYKDLNNSTVSNQVINSKSFLLLKKYFINTLYFLQNTLWAISVWKSDELEKFVKDYNPDIIFAPLYSGIFIHRIDRLVANITNKKIISYVSDDVYTFKQFSLSPFFWINRFILRKNVNDTSKYYSLLYTMTKEQKEEYEKALGIPMKVLKKVGNFDIKPEKRINHDQPIIITYGGNLISNRQKTLGELAKIIQQINSDSVKIILNIYTQSFISPEIQKLLHDGRSSFLHGKITMEELHDKYRNSDILLHVESFDLKCRLETRLSFSTKIIDLLNANRCVMAICWDKSSPYLYLKSEDAAICINNPSEIKSQLEDILANRQILQEYAGKAWDCGVKNHQKDIIIAGLRRDFQENVQ